MIAPIDKVREEGNCGRVTDRGEEACEDVYKHRVCTNGQLAAQGLLSMKTL